MTSPHELYTLLKKYGFFYMEGTIPAIQAEHFLRLQKQMPQKNFTFLPMYECCFERMLSPITSLYIEGLERFSPSGRSLGYSYDFYKATYLYDSTPRRMKVYGSHLTKHELLKCLKGFSFLLIERE